mmetsp:Transcript_31079/g.36465  ORF Transcript_31079/g.36465 Transcript_31079/m.36465 type:complete len:127 (-) Transcript_31079:678-1058(-)
MKTFAAVALAAVASASISIDDFEFMKYLSKFGKMYKTLEEFVERREIFTLKDLKIKAHNSRPSNFTLGHNKFSDWKKEEMAKLYGEKASAESNAYCKGPPRTDASNGDAPDYVNWVEAGMTTPIKD